MDLGRKVDKKSLYTSAIVILLIMTAMFIRFVTRENFASFNIVSKTLLGILRASIYIGLFSAWGILAYQRIIQKQVKRYLVLISALMVFWMLMRTIKFNVCSWFYLPTLHRYTWYFYYVGILFIPFLFLLVAFSIGKPEHYRLPKWTYVFLGITGFMLLLVLTNDLHQLIFTFPADAVIFSDDEYGYGFTFYLVFAWQFLLGLTGISIILSKCRIPRSKNVLWLPIIPFVIVLVYAVLYLLRIPLLFKIAGDMTVFHCLSYSAILESCIQVRLIPSNMHYKELFYITAVPSVIVDKENKEYIRSKLYRPIPLEKMEQAKEYPVMLEDGIRLSAAEIKGGFVFWTEDLSELLKILDELKDAKDSIEDNNKLLSAEYKVKAREIHILEQNRLYNIIQKETKRQIKLLSDLTDTFEQSDNEEERIRLLGKMTIIGAYLKRRSNLIFITDKKEQIASKELELAFMESADNLELFGVDCGLCLKISGEILSSHAMRIYDLFEEIVEFSLDSLQSITVFAEKKG